MTCESDRLAADALCLDPADCLLERATAPDSVVVSGPAPTRGEPASIEGAAEERERVRSALERCGYVQAKAARVLGLTPRQLAYRVRKYGIPLERF